MIYIIGVRHQWQDTDSEFFKNTSKEIQAYKKNLKLIINKNHINKIFEEWTKTYPPYRKPSITKKFIQKEYNNKISYYQIDPTEEDWPFKTSGYKDSKEKETETHDYREKIWVEKIKKELMVNDEGLLIVGAGHVQNKFFDKYKTPFSKRNSLQNKLQEASIKFEVIFWGNPTLINSLKEAEMP
jgi:hypothetical protein